MVNGTCYAVKGIATGCIKCVIAATPPDSVREDSREHTSSGSMTDGTEKELHLVAQLSKRLDDLNISEGAYGDDDFLKWLRGQEWDLNRTEQMFRKFLKWRLDNDVDNILSWEPPEFLRKNYYMDLVGFDNEGVPVQVIPFGRWDLKSMVKSGYRDAFIRYFDRMFEHLLAEGKKRSLLTKKPLHKQYTLILDADKLSMRTLASLGDTILEIVRRYENYYPDAVKAAYVVNATSVFSFLFSLAKPILSKRTFGRVHIYDNNASKWRAILADAISPDQLPLAYGGAGLTSMDAYLGFSELDAISDDESSEGIVSSVLSIEPWKTAAVDVPIGSTGSTVEWKFKTVQHDIKYSISFNGQTVLERQRVDSHSRIIAGSFICACPGIFKITFDNTFSRLRSKAVRYKIQVSGKPNGVDASPCIEE